MQASQIPPGSAFDQPPSTDNPSPPVARRTVFFSASSKDYEWRDRIQAALSSYYVEMWPDSTVPAGAATAWGGEKEAAIDRASVAVIMLSPDYLASPTAVIERSRLFIQRQKLNLRLFPIVVRECAWQSISEISQVEVWQLGRPIESLPGALQPMELQAIARDILRLLEEPVNPPETIAESSVNPGTDRPGSHLVSFSSDAGSVVSKARELMDDSKRNLVTSSCLIMAIAYEPDLPDASRRFLRTAIDHAIGYDSALKGFLTDGTRISENGSVFAGPSLGMVNPDVRNLLAEAEDISRRVSSSASPIEPRHLLAALLVSGQARVVRDVMNRLGKLRLAREQLRKDFLSFVEGHFASQDNMAGWQAILAPSEKITSPLPSDLKFSDATRAVFVEALRLMQESGRVQLSVSCLLFGMAAARVIEWSPTGRFLRGAIDKTGGPEGYEIALRAFDGDGDKHPRETINAEPPLGPMGRTVASVIKRAQEIFSKVSPGKKKIENRHLLAALLVDDTNNTPRSVEARLRKIGIDPKLLRKDFYNFLASRSEIDHQDILEQWHSILAPAPPDQPKPSSEESNYPSGTAGYTSEFCGVGGNRPVVDHLNMEANANRLAELIALRETQLPLAIGLFGNWGSGKSHFMNLIDQHLKALAARETDITASEHGKWCGQIVSIYFNAWHYLDTNLWASLVSQIFESLFVHLRPNEDDLTKVKKLQALLEKASGAAARAAEEVALARSVTEKARVELEAAERETLQKKMKEDGLLNELKSLSSLLPKEATEELKSQTVALLGVEKEVKTLDELRQVVAESQSLLRSIWNAAMKQPGRNWRLGWLSTALLIPIALFVLSLNPEILGRTKALVGSLVSLFPFFTWLLPKAIKARDGLKKLETLQQQAEAKRAEKLDTEKVKTAKREVTDAQANQQEAELRLEEAKAREKQLKEEAENLGPERRLGRFIEARAQSGDYRGQLGVVSLARRDFQALSDLFADKEALNRKVEAVEEKPGEKAANELKELKELKELSKSIDRIVLFVDDLDRCEPERVVDVLQAVHLLLAFPLFAVVVGVDQRCLRQSLRLQFKGLLTSEPEHKNGEANLRVRNDNAEERPATPLDYLEKVFHVPFHLPPMGETGFQTMIRRLTEPSRSEDLPHKGTPPKPPVEPSLNASLDIGTKQKPDPLESAINTPLPDPPQKTAVAPHSAGSTDQNKPPPTPSPKPPPPPQVLGSVPLQKWERDALEAYHPLVSTPRAVARLLNTYRLVRAGIPQEEWNAFKGDTQKSGEFRIVMLLLAAAAGHPAVARQWFESLRTLDDFSSLQNLKQPETDPGWPRFQKLYHETRVDQTPNLTPELFCKWLNRVEIFAF